MIRLLDETDPLHHNALQYYKHFLGKGIPMYFSTISIAEYCVGAEYEDLPFETIRIMGFNDADAREAGKFARILFEARSKGYLEIQNRKIIPNDSKIFAQGSLKKDIKYFVTADTASKKQIEILRCTCGADIQHLDIHNTLPSQPGLFDEIGPS